MSSVFQEDCSNSICYTRSVKPHPPPPPLPPVHVLSPIPLPPLPLRIHQLTESPWLFQGKDVHLNLHGVAGIKHCIKSKGRAMTLILYVTCANCQDFIPEADKYLKGHTICELSNSTDKYTCGSAVLKWFSDSEAYSDTAVKDDVCNWIKKALSQGRK